eukprot:TRINITY_DN669_c1_g1_i10.p1 TRINITY_DN669_c1_g1~~TRINITY_DN669_c1_g1_i10.p1  ORF type:complete len:321 (+),score=39.41 TRINITY_DN669_c1_g1_i10:62-964(+)
MSRFSFSIDKSLVAKATSNDEKPTPGYMFKEIAEMTKKSLQANQDLQDYLLKRLAKDQAWVRLKTLKVMQHCVELGSADFQSDMQQRTDLIKDCTSTQPSHPYHTLTLHLYMNLLHDPSLFTMHYPPPCSIHPIPSTLLPCPSSLLPKQTSLPFSPRPSSSFSLYLHIPNTITSIAFSGSEDTFHGDEINKQIRAEAQTLMNMLFDSSISHEEQTGGMGSKKMQGFGSTSSTTSSDNVSSGGWGSSKSTSSDGNGNGNGSGSGSGSGRGGYGGFGSTGNNVSGGNSMVSGHTIHIPYCSY